LGAVQLGELALSEGVLVEVEAWARSATTIADSLGYARQRVSARSVLARALALRRDAAARRFADEAVSLADSLGDPEAQFEALQARALALEALGGDAAAAHLQAIDLLESWRGRLALGDLRFGVTEPRSSAYEGAVRTLTAAGRTQDAFLAAERARARLLLELMNERWSAVDADTGVAGLRQSLREREEARRSVSQRSLQAALARDVSSLVARLDSLELVDRELTAAARIRAPKLTTLSELRSALLSADRALLAVHWGDSAVYGWWVTHDAIRGRRLGRSDSLAAMVDFLRGAIERPGGPDWRTAARRAYDTFVQPLAPSTTSEVLVVADGPLSHIPVEVLVPSDHGEPWGATRIVTYLPSASIGVYLATMPRSTPWTREVLAIGNPSVRSGVGQARERPSTDTLPPPLPHAANEARSIRDLFRPLGADVLIGPAATLQRWLSRDPGRYRFLHFAAHARVSDRRPNDTHVVLAESRLGLAAIRRLRLRAELVTLSACESALGQRVHGEGVIGLPHAFLAAGARAAVVSLWRVEDRSTAAFMEQFYRALRGGQTPGHALAAVRRAHLAMGGGSDHPSRWAAFILVGQPATAVVTLPRPR
jgi:CHAT domain-containing protein